MTIITYPKNPALTHHKWNLFGRRKSMMPAFSVTKSNPAASFCLASSTVVAVATSNSCLRNGLGVCTSQTILKLSQRKSQVATARDSVYLQYLAQIKLKTTIAANRNSRKNTPKPNRLTQVLMKAFSFLQLRCGYWSFKVVFQHGNISEEGNVCSSEITALLIHVIHLVEGKAKC